MKGGFFDSKINDEPTRKDKKIKLKEEVWVINEIKRQMYSELRDGIRKDLGERFTEADAEHAFQLLIEKCREEGIIKDILDDYLKRKIQDERQKYQKK